MLEVVFYQSKQHGGVPHEHREGRLFRGWKLTHRTVRFDADNDQDALFLDGERIARWITNAHWLVQERWSLERLCVRPASPGARVLFPAPTARCRRLFVPPPPRVLPPGPVPITDPELCVCEENSLPGIIWSPTTPSCEGGIQVVERCIYCERFASDEAAARFVAAAHGLEAVFLEDRPWDIEKNDRGRGYGCFGVRSPQR